jgi:hypothetical protein
MGEARPGQHELRWLAAEGGTAAVELPERGKCRGMGRLWGAGGWLGPRSRFGTWAYHRWWHLPLVFGLCYGILMFGISYFGVVNSRKEHHFVASLVEAAVLGAIFGLLMLGRAWWLQRKG